MHTLPSQGPLHILYKDTSTALQLTCKLIYRLPRTKFFFISNQIIWSQLDPCFVSQQTAMPTRIRSFFVVVVMCCTSPRTSIVNIYNSQYHISQYLYSKHIQHSQYHISQYLYSKHIQQPISHLPASLFFNQWFLAFAVFIPYQQLQLP